MTGCVEYILGGVKYHREDGPAIEWPDGRCEWWINGKKLDPQPKKRTNTLPVGFFVWEFRKNGDLHREDGPAFIVCNKDGVVIRKEWWVDGRRQKVQDLTPQDTDYV